MKSILDFETKAHYVNYLRVYLTASVLSSVGDIDEEPEEVAGTAVKIANAALKRLGLS